jgi:hypothetical protein
MSQASGSRVSTSGGSPGVISPPACGAGKLAGAGPLFENRFNLSLKFLILGVKMFTLGLKSLALDFGFSIALLPQVAVLPQILESAFEQPEFILDLLAFRFPLAAACSEERDQFLQGTSERHIRHDEFISSWNL